MEKLSQKQFKELGYEKLHRAVQKMLAQAQRMTIWFNAAERLNLLPALFAMKELVAQPGRREPDPNKPNWEDECRLLEITPEMVRQWKCRTAAETDIRHLLGEEPKKGQPTAPSDAQAKKYLEALTKAVLDGEDERAEKLANAFAEIYGF
jgi:hypothetical protein